MRELIISKLKQIEKDYNVRILLAVESGSRAWLTVLLSISF